ncbi:MAG: stalk domain-containing protein [Anaerotignaceae bacterium]
MKLDLKSIAIGIIIGSIGLTTVYGVTKNKNIDVSYNVGNISIQEKNIIFSNNSAPFIYNGEVYAPVRIIAENAGCQVSFNGEDNSVSISKDNSKDESKIRLLEEAIGYIGAVTPEKAIDIWSNGLKERSAALQYIVMTESLKESYVKSLEENGYDFWITGVSSPWVENYEVLKINKLSDDSYEYDIQYNTRTSEGSYNFFVTLKLVKEGDYWKVSEVKGDEDSQAYTGFVN